MLLFFAICHVSVLLFKSLYHHRRWLMTGITVYTSRTQLRAIPTFLLLVILNNSSSSPATITPAKLFVEKKNWLFFATPWVCFHLLRNCPQLSVCISPLVNRVHPAHCIEDLVWHSQKVDYERWQQVNCEYLLRK